MRHRRLTISVLLKFVPLKHSRILALSVSALSRAVVYLIYATAASTSLSLSCES
jgi:hypothetical protein